MARVSFGILTNDILAEFCERLRTLLSEGPYTFVASHEYLDYKPEVRTSLSLKGDGVTKWDSNGYSGFTVSDTWGVWGISAVKERPEGEQLPFFELRADFARITHRAGNGLKIHWVVAPHRREDKA